MREVRKIVFRRDAFRGGGRGGGEIPFIANDLAGLACGPFERCLVGIGVVARIRAVVPHDLQRGASLHRGPRVARDHGNTPERIELRCSRRSVDLHDAHDARHLERRGGVEAHDRSAVHLRPCHHRIEHPGQARVHPVQRLAGGDVLRIEELQLAGADVAKLRGILEPNCI
jgi:hypothetical protein